MANTPIKASELGNHISALNREYIAQQDNERDAKRWRMLCKLFYEWDRPRYGECGTFDIFLPCKTPSMRNSDSPIANSRGIVEHIIHPAELAEILDGFIADDSTCAEQSR